MEMRGRVWKGKRNLMEKAMDNWMEKKLKQKSNITRSRNKSDKLLFYNFFYSYKKRFKL